MEVQIVGSGSIDHPQMEGVPIPCGGCADGFALHGRLPDAGGDHIVGHGKAIDISQTISGGAEGNPPGDVFGGENQLAALLRSGDGNAGKAVFVVLAGIGGAEAPANAVGGEAGKMLQPLRQLLIRF